MTPRSVSFKIIYIFDMKKETNGKITGFGYKIKCQIQGFFGGFASRLGQGAGQLISPGKI